jgi:hypothetical protein
MAQHILSDTVWLLKGIIASEEGTLTLKNGRLSFSTDKLIFDSPLTEVYAVTFPWFYFGAGCALKINGTKYRFSFIQPGNTAGGEHASVSGARRKGRHWKAALTQSDSPE